MSLMTWTEIDLSAIRDNISAIRKRVGQGVKIIPAVKANAYGHGVIPVAKSCLKAGADMLAVACITEAEELRSAGFEYPILILGCSSPGAVEAIVENGIACTVCDTRFAHILSEAANSRSKVIPVHLKVDTGMGRIGVCADSVLDYAARIDEMPGIMLEGVFTHFPSSDEADHTYTRAQISEFGKIVSALKRNHVSVRLAHASNSGGILAYPEADYDAVRPGIMIYGYYPSKEVARSIALREALTLKSRIVFLKDADAGVTVSYGRTHTVGKKSKIATIPVGYADGYSRLLSNKAEAVVRGIKVPQIGRICMDQCMLDVSDVPGVEVGDEVILYGGGYDYLSVSEIAEKIGTISYEVLCNIGNRVKRVYIKE